MNVLPTIIEPSLTVPGARVAIRGPRFVIAPEGPPHVRIGGADARVVAASSRAIRVIVPAATSGTARVQIDEFPGVEGEIEIARLLASDVHQVDGPVFDRQGRLYVTQSGGRDAKVPVPLYRIGRDGTREPLAVDIANPTSLAIGPDGALYVSSRFDSNVYRLTPDDRAELYVTEVGVATGLAFAPDGTLFIGDRAGSILRISTGRQVDTFASLPSSVAAFHLAYGPDDCLYVTAPTLSSHDAIYRITPDREVTVISDVLGRPQGLAFDSTGALYVVDALAGTAGVYRIDHTQPAAVPSLVVGAASLIGLAFDPAGGLVLASNDAIWRLDVDLKPWPPRL